MQFPNRHIISLLIEVNYLIKQHHYFQKWGYGLICQNVSKKQAFKQYTYLCYNSANLCEQYMACLMSHFIDYQR